MPDVLVQTRDYEQFLFENSDFQTLEDNTLTIKGDISYDVHTVFAPGEWKVVSILDMGIQGAVLSEDLFTEIALFMSAGGQEVPDVPEQRVPADVSRFIVRTQDEVDETDNAYLQDDVAETVDGFLDTAYVAITGAIHVAGVEKTRECWEAIMRANTSKIDGTYGEMVTDPETGKILKPEGWQAPDIKGILGRY